MSYLRQSVEKLTDVLEIVLELCTECRKKIHMQKYFAKCVVTVKVRSEIRADSISDAKFEFRNSIRSLYAHPLIYDAILDEKTVDIREISNSPPLYFEEYKRN
jgi:hypothetical protein